MCRVMWSNIPAAYSSTFKTIVEVDNWLPGQMTRAYAKKNNDKLIIKFIQSDNL